MRGLIRTGGGGALPQTTDSAGNPAGNMVVANLDTPIQEIYADGLLDVSGTAAALLAQSTDISIYRGCVLTIAIGGAETLAITGFYDSAAANESSAILVTKTDGTFVAASALASGTYYFNNVYRFLKFTKSAAVETCTVTSALTAQAIL